MADFAFLRYNCSLHPCRILYCCFFVTRLGKADEGDFQICWIFLLDSYSEILSGLFFFSFFYICIRVMISF